MLNMIKIISIILMIANAGASAGIKKSTGFYKHNSKAGFRALELKADHPLNIEWNESNSTPKKIWNKLSKENYASANKDKSGKKFLKENRQLFGIKDPAKELSLVSQEQEPTGRTVIVYQQKLNEVKINSTKIVLIFNEDGSIESFEGNYFPTPELKVEFEISEETAARNAANSLENSSIVSYSSKMLLVQNDNELLPAYMISILSPSKIRYDVMVNGINGSIIKQKRNLDLISYEQ